MVTTNARPGWFPGFEVDSRGWSLPVDWLAVGLNLLYDPAVLEAHCRKPFAPDAAGVKGNETGLEMQS